ncbi:Gti1/Pac2 family-domain-containing protein [Gilbertella persicaria]|uniref:Gti1/Pac2 family-domain-containing protein n=1 Tax=Gilbertella persicaria TaxID=101096 RepID=UPI00221F767E|nr:Gti1/Pac2 family-domain-containing protein [Gilbertella persicaria]KAI8085958.1 Gti1/Pac2 family-domain-containing protein [Gilbertella persicaria]
MGNFLIYRELNKKSSSKQNIRKRFTTSDPTSPTRTCSSFDQSSFQRTRERQLVGSLSELYHFKENGLIKKTISLVVYGSPLHLISYYNPDDVLQYQLHTPSVVPELANLEISPELLSRQNFRIPPMIEPDNQYSNKNNESSSVSQSMLSPPTPTQSTPNTPLPQQIFRQYPSSSTPMQAPLYPEKEVNSPNRIHYQQQQHQEKEQQGQDIHIPPIMNTNNTFYL